VQITEFHNLVMRSKSPKAEVRDKGLPKIKKMFSFKKFAKDKISQEKYNTILKRFEILPPQLNNQHPLM